MATDLRRSPALLDPGSFESFYQRHQREIYRFVLHDVGNRADAEEVTQTAFLDAFRALRRGHEPEQPRAWMYGIARNAARRRYRTQSRRPHEVELAAELADAIPNGEEAQWVDTVRAAFVELKPSHREVVFLREVEGLSYSEIATRMELSQSAVETLLFRARRALRELLEAEGVGPAVTTVQPKAKSLLGLALVPAFVGRLADRAQQILGPELATKAAGAVTAVALSAGMAAGTRSAAVDPPVAFRDAPQAVTSVAIPPASAQERPEPQLVPDRAAPVDKAHPKRDKSSRGREGKRNGSDRPHGQSAGGQGGEGAATSGSTNPAAPVASVGGNGAAVGAPAVTVPTVEPPVEVPAIEPPVEAPSAPVEIPPAPVEAPPVSLPAVEAPSVEAPPVEVPPVEVELPVDPGGLLGD